MKDIAFDIKINGTDEQLQSLSKIEKELKSLTDQRKALNKAVKDGAITEDEYAASITEVNAKTRDLRKNRNAINKEIDQGNRLLKAEAGSYNALSAELSIAKTRWKQLTDEQRKNSKEGQQLKQTINQLDGELKELDAGVGVHTRNVGNYQSALSGLGGVFGQLGGFVEDFVAKQSDMSVQSEGQTGVVGRLKNTFGGLKGAIAGLGIGALIAGVVAGTKAWIDYNKQLFETRRLTKQLTGLSGDEMKQLRDSVKATADTFEQDFKETLTTVNAVAKQFGISQQEALDYVQKGFVAGADASGQFLEQLQEYPTQFKAAGLAADEMIAIITQNVDSGIYSDKGADAIKEGTLRLREMTSATREALDGIGISSKQLESDLRSGTISYFEAIQMVSGQLKELEDQSPEVGTAIADIFGGPGEDAGLEYIKTLGDIDTELGNLIDTTDTYQQTQLELLEANRKFEQVFSQVFGTGSEGFAELTARAKLFFVDGIVKIIEGGAELVNYFIRLYNESSAFRGVAEGALAAWNVTFDFMNTNLSSLIDLFKGLGSVIEAALTGNFSAIGDILNETGDKIAANYSEFGTNAAEAFQNAYQNTLKPKELIEPITFEFGKGKIEESIQKTVDNSKKILEEILEETRKEIAKLNDKISELQRDYAKLNDKFSELQRDYAKAEIALMDRSLAQAKAFNKLKLQDNISTLSEELTKEEELAQLTGELRESAVEKNRLINERILQEKELSKKEELKIEQSFSKLRNAEIDNQLAFEISRVNTAVNQRKKTEIEAANEILELRRKALVDRIAILDEEGETYKYEYQMLLEELSAVEQAQLESREGGGSPLTSWIAKSLGVNNQEAEAIKQRAYGLLNEVFANINARTQRQIQRDLDLKIRGYEREKEARLKNLQEQFDRGLISEEAYLNQKEIIENKYESKQEASRRAAFEEQKEAQKSMAWINALGGAARALADYQYPYSLIVAGLALAEGLIHVNEISKQTYALGGVLQGNSHAQGGIKIGTPSGIVEAEGGEAIINKRSMASTDVLSLTGTPYEIASAINAYKGYGVPFSNSVKKYAETGMVIPSVSPPLNNSIAMPSSMRIDPNQLSSLANTIIAGINSKKVVVLESDITEAQIKVQVLQQNSEW